MKNMYSKIIQNVYWIQLFLISLIGILIIFVSTKNFGVNVSTDSTTYFQAATQIINQQPVDMVLWPPLYPAILALFSSLFTVKILEAARIVNAIFFGITIFASGILFRRHLQKYQITLLLGICTVLLSDTLIQMYLGADSESPFILFSTLFLLSLDNYWGNKRRRDLLLSGFWVALCCLTRYAGVAFIFAGVLCIVWLNKTIIKKMVYDLSCYITVSSLPILAWLIRNKVISGTFTGVRTPSGYSYYDNIIKMGKDVSGWYVPEKIVPNGYLIAGTLLVIAFIVGIYFIRVWKNDKPAFSWQYPLIIYITIYIIFLIASAPFRSMMSVRFLSPIYIPLNLLLLSSLFEISKIWGRKIASWKQEIPLILFLLMFVALLTYRTKLAMTEQMVQGSGYTSKARRDSQTIRFLENDLPKCTVYTNGADVIGFLTGKDVNRLPRKLNMSGSLELTTLESLWGLWPMEENVCIVWFTNITWRDYYFTPEELLQITHLQQEIRLEDGIIYVVTKIHP
jgi:hypothetical protein